MNKILIDTNIYSHALRGAAETVIMLRKAERIAICSITDIPEPSQKPIKFWTDVVVFGGCAIAYPPYLRPVAGWMRIRQPVPTAFQVLP